MRFPRMRAAEDRGEMPPALPEEALRGRKTTAPVRAQLAYPSAAFRDSTRLSPITRPRACPPSLRPPCGRNSTPPETCGRNRVLFVGPREARLTNKTRFLPQVGESPKQERAAGWEKSEAGSPKLGRVDNHIFKDVILWIRTLFWWKCLSSKPGARTNPHVALPHLGLSPTWGSPQPGALPNLCQKSHFVHPPNLWGPLPPGALPNLCQEFHFVHSTSLRLSNEQSGIPDTCFGGDSPSARRCCRGS